MTRSGDSLIEFQDGTLVDVLYWTGPGYRVQWVTHRVVNEKREAGKHWVKVEVGYEQIGPDENGENKFWIPRWRICVRELPHTLKPD